MPRDKAWFSAVSNSFEAFEVIGQISRDESGRVPRLRHFQAECRNSRVDLNMQHLLNIPGMERKQSLGVASNS